MVKQLRQFKVNMFMPVQWMQL